MSNNNTLGRKFKKSCISLNAGFCSPATARDGGFLAGENTFYLQKLLIFGN